jgi:hypothetical protein
MVIGSEGVRWTGPDGALAIFVNGYALATLDADAPENALPAPSVSVSQYEADVIQYFERLGVPRCQVFATQLVAGASGGGTDGLVDGGGAMVPGGVGLLRAVDGIPIVESVAFASFDDSYQTIREQFYWPVIPSSTLSDARQFAQRLTIVAGLASYKKQLPDDAQGDGHVAIHHTSASEWLDSFYSVATYDVTLTGSGDAIGTFDENGQVVTIPP